MNPRSELYHPPCELFERLDRRSRYHHAAKYINIEREALGQEPSYRRFTENYEKELNKRKLRVNYIEQGLIEDNLVASWIMEMVADDGMPLFFAKILGNIMLRISELYKCNTFYMLQRSCLAYQGICPHVLSARLLEYTEQSQLSNL